MSSATATTTTTTAATATAEEAEMKTYWCHECDMSVALTSSSPPSTASAPLLCPHCHTHFLELMDSPPSLSPFPQFDTDPFPSSTLSFFDSPFLHHLIQRHLIATDTDTHDRHDINDEFDSENLQLEDSISCLLMGSSKTCADSIPTIVVTSSLLTELDPGGSVVLCAVCKDPIGVDSQAKQLPCNHLYHSDCITPWLAHQNSCPLCRFQLATEEDDDGAYRAREIRRQLRAAMMRFSELMEEEEDFYGLRTTLNHIATRHGLLPSAASGQNEENPSQITEAVGGNGNGNSNSNLERLSSFPVERVVFGSPIGGDGQSGITG